MGLSSRSASAQRKRMWCLADVCTMRCRCGGAKCPPSLLMRSWAGCCTGELDAQIWQTAKPSMIATCAPVFLSPNHVGSAGLLSLLLSMDANMTWKLLVRRFVWRLFYAEYLLLPLFR